MTDQTPEGAEPRTVGKKGSTDGVITIKKYANRRLYNTATSSYVTLDHLSTMVKEGQDFAVFDAKSGEDITRSVLTQIIVEEESKGQTMLPIGFLRQLISMYGDNLQWMVPRYLETSMSTFTKNQDQFRQSAQVAMQGIMPFQQAFEEMSKQNMAMFERAMRMFTPFAGSPGSSQPETEEEASARRLADLQRQISELEDQLRQMNELNRKQG